MFSSSLVVMAMAMRPRQFSRPWRSKPFTMPVPISRDARLRHATGSLLVGLVHPGCGLQFNPPGDERFQADHELLIMGPAEALENLTRLAGKVSQ